METHSPFNDLILCGNVYVLWNMIDYLSPKDLRHLSMVNKAAHMTLVQNVKFLGKAYISSLRGYKIQEWNSIPPVNHFFKPIEVMVGGLAEFIVIDKFEDPKERWTKLQLMLYKMGIMWEEKARYKYSSINFKSKTAANTYDLTEVEFDDAIEEMRATELELELLEKDENLTLKNFGFLEWMRYQLDLTRERVEEGRNDYREGLHNLHTRMKYRRAGLRQEKRKIRLATKSNIPMIRHFWPTLREEIKVMIRDRRQRAMDEQSKWKPNPLTAVFDNERIANQLVQQLTKSDILTLRSVCKPMERAIANNGIARTYALYYPLKTSLKGGLNGKKETNLLAWLYRMSPNDSDKYTLLRRLINARINEKEESESMMDGGRMPVRNVTISTNAKHIRHMHLLLRKGKMKKQLNRKNDQGWRGRIAQLSGLHKHIYAVFEERIYDSPRYAKMPDSKYWEEKMKNYAHVAELIPQLTAEANYIACNTLQASCETTMK